jgi:hypothetical protein
MAVLQHALDALQHVREDVRRVVLDVLDVLDVMPHALGVRQGVQEDAQDVMRVLVLVRHIVYHVNQIVQEDVILARQLAQEDVSLLVLDYAGQHVKAYASRLQNSILDKTSYMCYNIYILYITGENNDIKTGAQKTI